jgi:tetratricopeptide (TPR) repeat protein
VTIVTTASPFAGQLVVFTGRLSSLGRREAHDLVVRLGGEVADEVSVRTTMVVVGIDAAGEEGKGSAGETSKKLRRTEEINAKTPGRIQVLDEDAFCRLAGVPSGADLRQQYYGVRDIRAMYPALREDHLRLMEKWGVITAAARTRTDRYYEFSDLLALKQAAAQLEQGTPMRTIMRGLLAARSGQLAFDFRGVTGGAEQARVIAMERRPPASPPATAVAGPGYGAADPQEMLAAKYFIEAAALDDGEDAERQDKAAQAYRKALVIDPDLVPAIVNLANIHYARDELIEAQALYERAIILDPECFEAHFNLGNIHHDIGRYQDALVCYRDAVALNGSYADAHFYLAVTLEKMGKSQDARPHWKTYQRLAPDGEWVELAREFSD